MAAELITPTDGVTGFPLPLVPSENLMDPSVRVFANWHHPFHPNSAPELQSLGGRALRHSRVQLVEAVDHNHSKESYHAVYDQPPLPAADNRHAQFMLALIGCLGYVPRQGLDIYSDGRPIRDLTAAEMDFLRQPAKAAPVTDTQLAQFIEKTDGVRPRTAWRILQRKRERQAALSYQNLRYSYDPIRHFFSDYVLSEEQLDLSPRVMKRFLSSKDEATLQGRGEFIIGRASEVAVDPIRSVYTALRTQGLLHNLTPENPAKVVKNKLGSFEQRKRLYPLLQERIEELVA